ncbi:hypothetical protein FISHEDRAFT_68628 [Fistulina hepatica ATCC 64428]|uniref:Uncharacterized protein n=1 Tax=Fistulina hepatica ATCC 64428 TaxID=1128425 RepID=A0A0D7APM2_9AGAR|nr:hypothetical protein FISHEDRAFT_68628 [Fistulina hepatica ATCC 64428]
MLHYKHSRTLGPSSPDRYRRNCHVLLSTVHVSLGFYRLIEVFICLRNKSGGLAAKTTHSAFNSVLERWNSSLFSLSLSTNVVGTVLVAGWIWYLTKDLAPAVDVVSFRSRRILALVVESVMVYSAALVIEITLYFVGSNAFYIVYDPIDQLTAIVPTSIIVIASLGMTANDLQSKRALTSARFAPAMIGGTYDVTGSVCDVGDNTYDLDPDTSRSDFPPTTDSSLRPLDKLRSRLSTI